MATITKQARKRLGEIADVWDQLSYTQQLLLIGMAVWGRIDQMDKNRKLFYRLLIALVITVLTAGLVLAASESWILALAIGVLIGFAVNEILRSLR